VFGTWIGSMAAGEDVEGDFLGGSGLVVVRG
jgi:hypothetical protein